MGNVFLALCKDDTFLGKLFNKFIQNLENCHPVFSGKLYETESSLVNNIWKILNERNLMFVRNDRIMEWQDKSFTCQYFNLENHNEISNYIKNKDLKKINSIYRIQRNRIVLKKYESLVTKSEIKSGNDPPVFWNYLNEHEINIIEQINNGSNQRFYEYCSTFERNITREYWRKIEDKEISGIIWIDGSFIQDTKKGGAAVIIETSFGNYSPRQNLAPGKDHLSQI